MTICLARGQGETFSQLVAYVYDKYLGLPRYAYARLFRSMRIEPRGDFCKTVTSVTSTIFFVFSVSLVHCELFPMEPNSAGKLRKVCPLCNTTVHVRRAVCGCGYAKRRARPDSVLQAMKHERVHVRASETLIMSV